MSISLGIYKRTVSKEALKGSREPVWIPVFIRKQDGTIKLLNTSARR